MAVYDTDAKRWAAVLSKDPNSDSAFVYCVRTTQIYCRPTCSARLARRANVEFAENSQGAEAAGYRACKRCKPDLLYHAPHADIVARACLTISECKQAGERVSLRELSSAAGLTESHFHRVFKAEMGLTPRGYARSMDQPVGMTRASSSDYSELSAISADIENSDLTPYFILGDLSSTDKHKLVHYEQEPHRKDPKGQAHPLSNEPAHVEFTIQPWKSFYVLIAVAQNSICAIDTADTYSELIADLQRHFPQCKIDLSDWSPGNTATEECHHLFQSVMGALENPSGRIVNVSSKALNMSLVSAAYQY